LSRWIAEKLNSIGVYLVHRRPGYVFLPAYSKIKTGMGRWKKSFGSWPEGDGNVTNSGS
jgi:hypothetical protein